MNKELDKINDKIAVFEDSEIRRILVDDEWYYSVVDVIQALTDSSNPRNYWSTLKKRELENGVELSTNCVQLKMASSDGKKYITDCADNEGIFRILQSIPSKKAEPFKKWLARLGKERLDEISQPAKAIERANSYYIAKGYSPDWVQTRTASIQTRTSFTDTLKEHGITENKHYGILTNEMYQSWSGFNASEYKEYKNLNKSDSLRDNMTPLELAATIFSEETAKEIIKNANADGFFETKNAIHIAGKITNEAIVKIEKQTGKKVVTHENMKALNSVKIQKELIIDSSDNIEKE